MVRVEPLIKNQEYRKRKKSVSADNKFPFVFIVKCARKPGRKAQQAICNQLMEYQNYVEKCPTGNL